MARSRNTGHGIVEQADVAVGGERLSLGGKSAGLGRLVRLGCRVPPFFVVEPWAQTDNDAFRAELEGALARIGPGTFAVRSSATAEDSADHSFAGQFETVLGVADVDGVLAAIQVCRASIDNERVRAYREMHGVDPGQVAVVVQRMIEGSASGVMFSRDPERPEFSLVSAGIGLGEGVVQGLVPCDTFRVAGDGRIEREIETKDSCMVLVDGKPVEVAVPEERQNSPAIRKGHLLELAHVGRAIEKALGCPQDIEWTVADGEVYFLQSRPITVRVAYGKQLLWDNSNIVESYSGITTPLTYSFARTVYATVYRLFCGVMGVEAETIAANERTYRRMIGLVRGRVYYNLNAWYRVLTLLPGFKWNRTFMEQMMGVSEAARDQDAEAQEADWQERLSDLPKLIRLFFGLFFRLFRHKREVERFQTHFTAVMAEHRSRDMSKMSPHELLEAYADLEQRLLQAWTPPIVNDFLTMIFHGVLRKLCTGWITDGRETDLANALLSGEGSLASTEPTRALLDASARIRRDVDLHTVFRSTDAPEELLEALCSRPDMDRWLKKYLERYGDRCIDELKLETLPLRDNLDFIALTLRNYARAAPIDPDQFGVAERRRRDEAERKALSAVRGLRRRVFRWVLNSARTGVAVRESLRFERTRVFGLVRDIMTAMGHHMAAAGVLESHRDVFYLQLDEVLGWVDGTCASSAFKELVAVRQKEFDGYREGDEPAERFLTLGPVHRFNSFRGDPVEVVSDNDGLFRGTACYPGIVTAPVRIVHSPNSGIMLNGEILVAARTDPGWVPLFPSVSGLLVERGSLLSHSAVVAREMGLPTVVGLRGITTLLTDGERVRLDGDAGTVERLDGPADTPEGE